jgi:ketosteroid isomerase-like protein
MTATSVASTRAVVDAWYEAALAGDLSGITALLSPDVVIHEPDSLPYGGEHVGREAALSLLGMLFAGVDRDAVVIEHIVCNDVAAAAMLQVPFKAPDGTNTTVLVCETFEIRGGLITRVRPYYFDTAALLAAMA